MYNSIKNRDALVIIAPPLIPLCSVEVCTHKNSGCALKYDASSEESRIND